MFRKNKKPSDTNELREVFLKSSEALLSNLTPEYAKMSEDTLAFRMTLDAESDRGCALMSASYLDDQLDPLIKAKLVDNKKIMKSLFDFRGVMGTFSSKIDMSYMLGLLPENVTKDLHTIRNIRNHFAHSPSLMTFEDQKIKDLCKNLKLMVVRLQTPL